MPMTSHRWTRAATPLALSLFALTACTSPQPTPIPSSTTEVVFASEEEALAAVTATYKSYLEVSNTILVEGALHVSRIDEIVGGKLLASEHDSLMKLASDGRTLTGAPVLVNTRLIEWYSTPDAAGVLAIAEACIDMTPVDVLDATGTSVVGSDRPATRTWSIQVGPRSDTQPELVLLDRTAASEGASCER